MAILEARCYWAGILIERHQLADDQMQEVLLRTLEERLQKGEILFASCGVTHVLTELCVDIMREKVLVSMHNLKK